VVVAAVIVITIGSIVFARRSAPPDLRISGKVSGTPTPTAERPGDDSSGASARPAFAGSGSWVMSSLPSCFHERELMRGSVAELRPKFPPTSERVRPPAVVLSGECTIFVRGDELLITRGPDRLRVPPVADLYRDRTGLTLVYVHGSRAEIRKY
jgi:hypothetical protein